MIGDFRNQEEEDVLKGHLKEWNYELIRGEQEVFRSITRR
jgi:hypothetical protein